MRLGVKLRFSVRAVGGSASEWEICEGRYNKCSNTIQYNAIIMLLLNSETRRTHTRLVRALSVRHLSNCAYRCYNNVSRLIPNTRLRNLSVFVHPAQRLMVWYGI